VEQVKSSKIVTSYVSDPLDNSSIKTSIFFLHFCLGVSGFRISGYGVTGFRFGNDLVDVAPETDKFLILAVQLVPEKP
jgi:hypothetical protein